MHAGNHIHANSGNCIPFCTMNQSNYSFSIRLSRYPCCTAPLLSSSYFYHPDRQREEIPMPIDPDLSPSKLWKNDNKIITEIQIIRNDQLCCYGCASSQIAFLQVFAHFNHSSHCSAHFTQPLAAF